MTSSEMGGDTRYLYHVAPRSPFSRSRSGGFVVGSTASAAMTAPPGVAVLSDACHDLHVVAWALEILMASHTRELRLASQAKVIRRSA
jgi:hypothetical protein